MSSGPMTVKDSIYIGIQHFRIFFCKPGRRRRSRCTEDNFHSHFLRQFQKPFIKFISKISFCGLYLAPRKFRYTNHRDSMCQHSFQIIFPQTFRPVFRIIAGSHHQLISIYNLSHHALPYHRLNDIYILQLV